MPRGRMRDPGGNTYGKYVPSKFKEEQNKLPSKLVQYEQAMKEDMSERKKAALEEAKLAEIDKVHKSPEVKPVAKNTGAPVSKAKEEAKERKEKIQELKKKGELPVAKPATKLGVQSAPVPTVTTTEKPIRKGKVKRRRVIRK